MEIKPVAHVYTDFPTKFGVPRQSGLVPELKGRIVFEPYYRNPEAVKGLEEYSHIWVLWDFSQAHREEWAATAKPPRLGGKTHKGIWATRSPFRPNNIALSSVRLDSIEFTKDQGPVLHISGIDMMDGSPVYDIKPYIRFDCHPEAKDGFVEETSKYSITVEDPEHLIEALPISGERKMALMAVLEGDPRPRYDADDTGTRRYGFFYCGYDVRFVVKESVLTVVEIVKV